MLIVMTVSLVGCASEAVRADDLMVGIERSLYAPTPQPEEYGEKLTDFAVKLFKSCVASDGKQNVIISPLSLLLAVSMTAEGAEGETLSQIENAFGLSLDEIRKYSLYLLSQNRNLTNKNLKIANSIWFRKDESFEVNSDFLQTNVDYYDASVYSAPFNNSTVDEINKWVDQKTEIDEEGTKAAAATLVEVACAESGPHEFKVVHLNRPYIYMLFDTETCAPFFIGVMRNPDPDTI